MSIISIILVVIVAFLAGMEGILDEFQFHQPLVACTLILVLLPAIWKPVSFWAERSR